MKAIATILVPIDFTEASLHALDDAVELARTFGASVVAMHSHELPVVATPTVGLVLAPLEDSKALVAAIDARMRAVIGSRADRGVAIRWVLREGPAPEAIDAVASELDADLIVLATHGRHGVLHALLGSVSEKVVRTAARPVLILPLTRRGEAR